MHVVKLCILQFLKLLTWATSTMTGTEGTQFIKTSLHNFFTLLVSTNGVTIWVVCPVKL